MDKEKILKKLSGIIDDGDIKVDESMAKHTSFKVGGNADFYITVKSADSAIAILNEFKDTDVPITIVGNGTNLLVRDGGIRGIVMRFVGENYEIKKCDIKEAESNEGANKSNSETIALKEDDDLQVKVKVEAGMLNAKLAQILMQQEIGGFEFASGIPGTIGGAIYMNGGAFGTEMKDIVEKVTYVDLTDNTIHSADNQECGFDYRKSNFMSKKTLILSATLKLTHFDKAEIASKMTEYREKRISTQPYEFPSAGSTFKRGSDFITAKLIDEAGLKGTRVGGAEVSTKHAGFIINAGGATANDILELVKIVKAKVYEKFQKKIELEVRVIGEDKKIN